MTAANETALPLTVIAQMRAKPGKEAELRAALEALIEPTTRDEGYLTYDLHQGADDPTVFFFYENWADRATHAAHMQTPHLQRFIDEHLGLLGVNPVDWKTRAGGGVAGVLGRTPWVLGWDVAGVVDQLGGGVTRFAVGDAVYGMPRFPHQAGGYAEYVTAPSRQLARKPARLDHVSAAGLPLAGLTAWQALIDTADLQPGQRVLIHGAAGGVGHLAVQVARWRGVHVIGTASAAKHDRLRTLGADELIDYTTTRFEDATGDIDVVLDLVGGNCTRRSLTVLRPGGLLLAIPSAADLPDPAILERHQVRGVNLLVEPDGHALEQLARLVDDQLLTVHVAATADLADVAELHRAGESGRTFGKLIATV